MFLLSWRLYSKVEKNKQINKVQELMMNPRKEGLGIQRGDWTLLCRLVE